MEGELEVLLAHHDASPLSSQATRDFIAGAIGGMAGVVAGQPLDTLRIRIQQQRGGGGGGSAGAAAPTTTAAAWRALAAAEGPRALFRGMSYPLATTALQNAVTFQAQRAGERAMAAAGVPPGAASAFVAGSCAGALQAAITSPVELLKIRLQLQRARPGAAGYVGPVGMLKRVLRDEGAHGLFRGFGVTLLRDTPSYGLYFAIYAAAAQGIDALLLGAAAAAAAAAAGGDGSSGGGLCSSAAADAGQGSAWASSSGRDNDSSSISSNSSSSNSVCGSGDSGGGGGTSMVAQLLAGGLAGMLAWLSVYPLDVVKSRLQAHPAAASPYRGAWHCAVASARAEGAGAFARGLWPTLSRAFIVNAAIFATFEACVGAAGGGEGGGGGGGSGSGGAIAGVAPV